MAGAVEIYEKLVRHARNVWLPRQFENPDNIAAHGEGTGREIIHQMKGEVDAFVLSLKKEFHRSIANEVSGDRW